MALSPEAQEAAAKVYQQKGDSLDQIEADHPELAGGVKRLRDAIKPRRGRRGSGPAEPVESSRPQKFS